MAPRPTHADVEQRFRRLIEEADLPAPDEVAHWRDVVAFYWHEMRAVIVVDLDEVDETLEEFDPRLAFGVPEFDVFVDDFAETA